MLEDTVKVVFDETIWQPRENCYRRKLEIIFKMVPAAGKHILAKHILAIDLTKAYIEKCAYLVTARGREYINPFDVEL